MRWIAEASPGENAREALPEMTRQWFTEGARVTRPGTRLKDLHAFRLKTKHFRYTLELFRDLYGPGLDRRLALLRDAQRKLGELNDCIVARQAAARVIPDAAARKRAQEFLQDCEHRRANAFRRYWIATFGGDREEALWRRYLSRPRGAKL